MEKDLNKLKKSELIEEIEKLKETARGFQATSKANAAAFNALFSKTFQALNLKGEQREKELKELLTLCEQIIN